MAHRPKMRFDLQDRSNHVADAEEEGAIAFVGRKSQHELAGDSDKEGTGREIWQVLLVLVFAAMIGIVLWVNLFRRR